MRPRHAALVNGNALRLGLLGTNCSSGRTYAALSERWEASWENNVRLAQVADAVGIECVIPIARWKGDEGESNPHGSSFERSVCGVSTCACRRRFYTLRGL
jgi:FMNH2-dependent dimethyl sulfone monooxygenase